MATVEAVGLHSDGQRLHAAELKNIRTALDGGGVLTHTLAITVTEGDRNLTVPAFNAFVPDGSGNLVYVAHAGATVPVTASAATPRMDLLTLDAAGTLGMQDGAATAETGNVREAPLPPLDDDEILIAVVRSPANQSNVLATNVRGRALAVKNPRPLMKVLTSGMTAISASTTFTPVTDGTNALSFNGEAGTRYRVRVLLPVTYGGTGGLKLQFTGPAGSPVLRIDAIVPSGVQQGADAGTNVEDAFTHVFNVQVTSAAGFSSAFISMNSAAADNVPFLVAGVVRVDAEISLGTAAGTIALEAAQNSANSTTTIGTGARLEVEEVRKA